MARAENAEIIDRFEEFYRSYYRNEIGELAQKYPSEQKSLYVDWDDLYRFDPDIADDFIAQPAQMQEYAEEALRLYDLPVDVKLGSAHVRVRNLGDRTGIRDIRADHVGNLVSVQGIVRKATDVRPRMEQAAFECQRCGTMTRIPQSDGEFQEPHECQGCERQGPFAVNFDQSEFVDSQKIRVQESPEGLRGGETPQAIDVNIEDDITGKVTAGDHVTVVGVLRLEQQGSQDEKSAIFDFYMDGVAVTIEDEQFEEMDISEEDKKRIIELSSDEDIYDEMVASMAPSIYGYEKQKQAIILQLFSGVRKNLPDDSRIRGDLHILLIGDPGTGKCVESGTKITLADGSEVEIGDLVESNLDDPTPVDDGVYDEVDIDLPTMAADGTLTTANATKVWKREAPDSLYRIHTRTGRELTVTPSHPLFAARNGEIQPVVADDLTEDDFLASPRSLPTDGNTNRDVIPDTGETLREIRRALGLAQSECGLPRTTYQHYERGDRNPGRESLRSVLDVFEARVAWLEAKRTEIAQGRWDDIESVRDELGVSQSALAAAMDVTQTAIGYDERNGITPDGGHTATARRVVLDRLDRALAAEADIQRLRTLSDGDLSWDRIDSIEAVEPDDEWVFDLEVEGTHSYIANNVVSHNSKLLQYVKQLSPRSVYTSGKGSSAAGLCVTGETMIHTDDGFRPIRELVTPELPEPVDEETSIEKRVGLQTFDRETGRVAGATTSHAWRMPEKPCRRIETNAGKEIEASVKTPVLVCGEEGIEWREISEVEPGDHVAVPRYDGVQRRDVPVRELFELTSEKVLLADESVDFLRERLCAEFGTLRNGAAELGLSEDFIHLHLKNRHVPQEKLDRILDAVGASRSDVQFDRAMARHGDGVAIPETFDEEFMYLLGLVFGDGDIRVDRRGGNQGMVRISNSDEELLERAADIFETTFDVRPEIERQADRVPCIRVSNVTVARLFASAGMATPKESLSLAPELTVASHADAFLRGLMDADGSVSRREKGGSSVLFSTISEDLAQQVQLMLETYGVHASTRERDRRGTYELADGQTIESKHTQQFVEMYGADIDRYADAIGFECAEKQQALDAIVATDRPQRETIPIGSTLATVDGPAGGYHNNMRRSDDPGRARARSLLGDVDLGETEPQVREAVDASLRWDEVVAAVDTGEKEVFDLTVPETHNFVGNGIVTHNTAAAVRDDFAEGQQWTLEAGALVLADQGVAAVDELDKMRCVTGDTLVHLGDRIARIEDFAHEAAEDGEVETLPNGRTVRDIDAEAWTMTEDGRLVKRPVRAVHEYDAPDTLTEVRLRSGDVLTSTPDHPYFVFENGKRTERSAADLTPGEHVYVPAADWHHATDGGAVPRAESGGGERQSDVELRSVEAVSHVRDDTYERVYDLTVEGTHNFVANGMVVHNSEDQSAMHQALEQQEISISKAGINATLKSRCSLLGAANPIHGRFDEYEPMAEQIDLDPPLISRFDLIFTVTDRPDEEEDRALAEHIIETNYAGELFTHRESVPTSNVSEEEVAAVSEDVEPAIETDLLRKYVAYAKRNCFPTMTEEAKAAIRDFYVDLRLEGQGENNPIPVTARKLEALVRLAEASARVRLSDSVETEDAERVIGIVRSSLEDVGIDPETGELDADIIESGTSKSQRDRIKNIKGIINELEEEYEDGAPVEEVYERAEAVGMDREKAEHEIEKLRQKGEIYEPTTDHLRAV